MVRQSLLARLLSPPCLTPLLLTLAGNTAAQAVLFDNRDGAYVNLEEAPVHALELRAGELWLANVAGASVTVYAVPSPPQNALTLTHEIPVGLGPVTVRCRPGVGQSEMWVVCQSSGTVFVIDGNNKTIEDAFMVGPLAGPAGNQLALGSEPCGLVFNADGSRAYCTLSAINQIVEIDAGARQVLTRVDFGDTFHPQQQPPAPPLPIRRAEEPRALVISGSLLYALSFESGNGTATEGQSIVGGTIFDHWASYLGGQTTWPPPDRDLFAFPLSSSTPSLGQGQTALWRMGNLNFDVQVRPNTIGAPVFFVSNIEHKNLQLGEHAVRSGGIAIHRVSYASAVGTTIPQATTHIDLNDAAFRAGSLPVQTVRFATPNEMVFSANGNTLYVCCYETKNTAVIDLSGNTPLLVAELKSSGAGPRGLALDAARLYVYNRASCTVDVFDVNSPSGSVNPLATVTGGYDPTPSAVKAGRLHHINAANSNNGTQSCNTCHMDGHWDRIAWDLGEFTGQLPAHKVPKKAKGVKVTQSMRGTDETPPLHWSGDRSDLAKFNPAFAGLLGGTELNTTALAEYEAYVFSLSIPPNPRQRPRRVPSTQAAAGQSIFNVERTPIDFDTNPSTSNDPLACYACHSQRGISGTNNQIVNNASTSVFPGLKTLAANPAHLRGLFDKEADAITYDPPVVVNGTSIHNLSATGWGFGNNGFAPSLVDFIARQFPHVNTQLNRENLAQFLREFDSGLAPSTAWSWTLDAASAGSPSTSPVKTYLGDEETKERCEIAVRGRMTINGSVQSIGFLHDGSLFLSDHGSVPAQSYDQLNQLAAAGATFVFMGVPRGMGRRIGIDRDLDYLSDGVEQMHNTSPTNPDTDGDGFPDGYEVANTSDPLLPSSTPVSSTAPVITASDFVYQNFHVAKFRWQTDIESSSRVTVLNLTTNQQVAAAFDGRMSRYHTLLVRGLGPGSYQATLESLTPNGVLADTKLLFDIAQPAFQSTHVDSVALTPQNPQTGQPVTLLTTVKIVRENGAAKAGAQVQVRFVEWTNGPATITTATATTNASGLATFTHVTQNAAGSGAHIEVIVDDVICGSPDFEHYFSPLDLAFSAKTQI